MQKEAKEAGYYTVDEFAYQGRMPEWTPKILANHESTLFLSHSLLTRIEATLANMQQMLHRLEPRAATRLLAASAGFVAGFLLLTGDDPGRLASEESSLASPPTFNVAEVPGAMLKFVLGLGLGLGSTASRRSSITTRLRRRHSRRRSWLCRPSTFIRPESV